MQHTTQRSPVSLEIYHGLWLAMIAKALIELGIPDLLVNGQKTVAELAKATRTHPIKLSRFLRATASCGFICEVDTGVFTASEQTAAMVTGQPVYYLTKHLLNSNVVASWSRLSENLAEEEPAINAVIDMSLWEFLDANPQQNAYFNGAMTVLSEPINPLISRTYPDWSGTVVDVGGGQGTLVRKILEDHSEVRGIIFDREQALPAQEEELGDHCTCVAGNFLETVPQADIYLFKNVLHNWSNEDVLKIFKNVRAAAPDGKILIAELMISEPPSFAACSLDLAMMVENGGSQRTVVEFQQLLEQAGFRFNRQFPVGRSPYSLLEAV